MNKGGKLAATSLLTAAVLCCATPGISSGSKPDLLRDALLQQSAAQRTGCTAVQRTLKEGADAMLVVRTAVEIGYNACQVIRCSLDGSVDPEKTIICDKVVRGAVQAGVQPDVISRCTAEYCDPARVAALLGDAFLEPNYCYLAGQPLAAPDALPPQVPVIDRSAPPSEASPFRF